MGIKEILAGMQMFQQGVQEYAIGSGIRQAQRQMNEINEQQRMGAIKEQEAQQQLNLLSQNLAMTLGSIGIPRMPPLLIFFIILRTWV